MKIKIKPILAAILAVLLLTACAPITGVRALAADEREYTNVLDDLQKDGNFNVNDYLINEKDYSISVIQIAESAPVELFVYTYQPAFASGSGKDLTATCINMALKASDFKDGDLKLYDLEYLNSSGVFVKYKVKDFAVLKTEERYYNIVSILRKWYEFDGETGNDNTISEVPYGVEKCYHFIGQGNKAKVECKEAKAIQVTGKYCGFVRYKTGVSGITEDGKDSHYIAFSTDLEIDDLLEIEISYGSQFCENYKILWIPFGSKDPMEHTTAVVRANESETVEIGANAGLFSFVFQEKHQWNSIERAPDFLKNNDLKNIAAKEKISELDWVVRFVTTPYYYSGDALGSNVSTWRTVISEETVTWLKFQTDGKVYSLGVIDNKQNEGKTPGGVVQTNWFQQILEAIKKVFTKIIPWWVWVVILSLIIVPLAVKLIIAIIESRKGSKKR